MSNQARALDIAAFISEVKRLLSTGKYENEILGLTVGDYYKGPKQDLDPNRPGDIWEFKKNIDGIQFYVKVKIVQENGEEVLKCIGFHEDYFA